MELSNAANFVVQIISRCKIDSKVLFDTCFGMCDVHAIMTWYVSIAIIYRRLEVCTRTNLLCRMTLILYAILSDAASTSFNLCDCLLGEVLCPGD